MRQQFDLHLKDWLQPPLDEITKSQAVDRHRPFWRRSWGDG